MSDVPVARIAPGAPISPGAPPSYEEVAGEPAVPVSRPFERFIDPMDVDEAELMMMCSKMHAMGNAGYTLGGAFELGFIRREKMAVMLAGGHAIGSFCDGLWQPFVGKRKDVLERLKPIPKLPAAWLDPVASAEVCLTALAAIPEITLPVVARGLSTHLGCRDYVLKACRAYFATLPDKS